MEIIDVLARQDATLRQIDAHLARQDAMLARLGEIMDACHERATAAQQATAVALQRYAETRLDIDRFLATAERVLAAWERQPRP